jgi:drug/metabolite transporter (DMT)-like permease
VVVTNRRQPRNESTDVALFLTTQLSYRQNRFPIKLEFGKSASGQRHRVGSAFARNLYMTVALPHLAILGATLMWASSFAAGRLAVATMPASEILMLRFAIAAALLWLAVALVRRSLPNLQIAREAFWIGFLGSGLATIFVYWGLILTTAVNAAVITSWMPLVSSILAWRLLKESISRWVLIGSAFALCGVLILVSDDRASGSSSIWGDLLCVASLVIACFAQIRLRRIGLKFGNTLAITAWQLTGGAVCMTLIMVFFESWFDERGWMAVPGIDAWLLIAYLAIFVGAAAFALNNFALRHLTAGHVSLYVVLMAPMSVPISALVIGEVVTWIDVAAIALVTFGVALPVMATRLIAPSTSKAESNKPAPIHPN